MNKDLTIETILKTSEDVVAREVGGEFILIPITSGIGDMEDELYTLNETGRDIWNRLDGKKTLSDIISELSNDFDGDRNKITEDCIGFCSELLRRKMVILEQ